MSLSWLTPDSLNIRLLRAVEEGKPFNLLRFGDGEYEVCKYATGANHTDTEFMDKFTRWFGKDGATSVKHAELVGLAELILESFRHCDFLGIPCFREAYGYPKWSGVDAFVNKYMPKKQTFYFYDIFTLWRRLATFQTIIKRRTHLDIITCRDRLPGKLMARFPKLKTVRSEIIQPEHFMWHRKNSGLQKYVTAWTGGPHYPQRYHEICDTLQYQGSLKGRLFIVGAGGLGKIYCHLVKQHGGMAIDLGAMLDGWDGLVTRPYLKRIEEFRL